MMIAIQLNLIHNATIGGVLVGQTVGRTRLFMFNPRYTFLEIASKKYSTGTLRLLTATDCIKDRLAAYYHWRDEQGLEQAI